MRLGFERPDPLKTPEMSMFAPYWIVGQEDEAARTG
jgi:hypothetical protein